ncbi:MAG: urease accessory protein UreD [Pseudohongiella sp.]|nr:urease accessory protein UreD [Pseudohongiella sp.]MDP2127320.1 urease accessory protein UreD [Pseudohongiella sp.]
MISTDTLPAPAEASHWRASLQLRFAQSNRGCRLMHSAHQGPLYVQKPFYPEGSDLAHVYLLHPPGGLVSGDRLSIDIRLEKDARVLVTTPGAGRVYRARSDRTLQQQCTTLVLENDAVMEYLPQENIIYPSASARLDTKIEMAPGSRFIGWEICCLGLPASDLRFSDGELSQRLSISAGSRPLLVERFELNDLNRELYESAVGLRGQPVTALMVAGPFDEEQRSEPVMEHLLETLRAVIAVYQSYVNFKQTSLCAVTVLNGFVVARYLGSNADEAKRLFISLWQVLRPQLTGREACAPRIWAT